MNSEELKLQAECVGYLKSMGIFCHSVPNEAGGRSAIYQAQLVAAGLKSGVADLVVWWPSDGKAPCGGCYPSYLGYVEMKRKDGRQTENQKTFQRKCIESNIEYAVIRSLEDFKTLVEDHLYGNAYREERADGGDADGGYVDGEYTDG